MPSNACIGADIVYVRSTKMAASHWVRRRSTPSGVAPRNRRRPPSESAIRRALSRLGSQLLREAMGRIRVFFDVVEDQVPVGAKQVGAAPFLAQHLPVKKVDLQAIVDQAEFETLGAEEAADLAVPTEGH